MLTELLINLFGLSPICCAIFIQHIFVTGSVCQVAFDLQMSSYLFVGPLPSVASINNILLCCKSTVV